MTRPRHLANGRVCPSQGAAAPDGAFIVGSSRIARKADKSKRTILRWVRDGVLLAGKVGPFPTSPLIVRAADLDRLVSS